MSISTVSLAINSPQRVKESTRARVLDAIEQLGYAPKTDVVARARRGVGRIGVLAPFSSHPTFALRLNGVLRTSVGRSLEVVVYDEPSAADSLLSSLPLTGRVDGMIVMGLPFSDEVAERLVDQRVTTVLVDLRRQGFSSVTIDDAEGGRMVAAHLLGRGHRRLAYVGHAQHVEYDSPAERRLRGFRDGLRAGGAPLPDERIRLVEHSAAAARAAADELLDGPEPPTGIFAYDDTLAGGVLRAVQARGLRPGAEVAIVGFDDSEIADLLGLTSVNQPFAESGAEATRTLMAQLADPGMPARRTTLELSLVVRETS